MAFIRRRWWVDFSWKGRWYFLSLWSVFYTDFFLAFNWYAVLQKPQKVNLRKMIASKRGEGTEILLTIFTCLWPSIVCVFLLVIVSPCLPLASALPDRTLSSTESEPESENRVRRIPSLPKSLPASKALQHPVDPSPISFLSKVPQMTSTPLPGYRKVKHLCWSFFHFHDIFLYFYFSS